MATYGRSGSDSDVGTITSTQRASVFDPMPEHGWGYAMGGRFCSSGSSNVRLCVWDAATGPTAWQARTNVLTVNNVGSSAGQCQLYTGNVTLTDSADNPTNSAVMLWSGRSYALGYTTTGSQLYHQMAQAANVSYDDEQFYDRSIGSTTPTDPFGATSIHVEGAVNAYITYDPNVAPDKPTAGIAPTGTGAFGLTPTFTANFTDGNTGRGDKLYQYDIELRQAGSGTLKWNNAYDASPSEQSGAAMSKVYDGTALVSGNTYEWRVRFRDLFGAWGPWSNTGSGANGWFSFTINAGGTVATPSTPSGKIETVQPTPFQAVWSHASALSTNQVSIRIKQGSSVVRGPFTKAATVANGGTISFTWAETGFADLAWGTAYTVEIQGRDTLNVTSPWSTGRAFNTNAYPSIPSSLLPATGLSASVVPLLSFVMTDTDDTTGTGLTAELRLKDALGAVLSTKTPTYNGTTGRWEFQPVAGVNEVQRLTRAGTISGGTFTITVPANVLGGPATSAAINWNDNAATIQTKLEAMANVGAGNVIVTGGPVSTTNVDITFQAALGGINLSQITHTSSLTGGGTLTPSTVTNGAANDIPTWATYKWDARGYDGTLYSNYSTEYSFVYANGPVVTAVSPTGTITTHTPTITWTVANQQKYQVLIYLAGTTTLVYDSGLIVSGTSSHSVPSGYLHNNTAYDVVVTVTNTNNLVGSNQAVSFTVTFTPPSPITGFSAVPIAIAGDYPGQTSSVLVSWALAEDSPANFIEYTLTRQADNEEVETILARIPSINQTTYVDYFPISGENYTYRLYKVIYQGTDITESAPSESVTSVLFDHTIITSAINPTTNRVALRIARSQAVERKTDRTLLFPWGSSKPVTMASPIAYAVVTGSYMVYTNSVLNAEDAVETLAEMETNNEIVCYRDERGKKYWGFLQVKEDYAQMRRFTVGIVVTETDYTEGVP